MSSSKVILIGAVSVVFGLYSLSLNKVGTYVGGTAEIAFYLAKAEENAKSGVSRALNVMSRGNFYSWETFNLTDPNNKSEGSFRYTVSYSPSSGWVWNSTTNIQVTITSRGTYKAPGEPAAFVGHEVTRTAYAVFDYKDVGNGYNWIDVKLKSAYSTVDYTRERQLDSLQTLKGN